MPRSVTMFTGQWADLPLDQLAKKVSSWGYDGLELACWGDHFEVSKATAAYCKAKRNLLKKNKLDVWAISAHLAGQIVCDRDDPRTDAWVPAKVAGKGEAKREWAAEEMKRTAKAAAALGVKVVNGFTGSSIWPLVYAFPPVSKNDIEEGFKDFAKRWNPILDVFGSCGVKFALEVHPTEIAFDIHTARMALDAVDRRPEFGFNFDPSHLQWQGVDPAKFIRAFPDRIYHVHIKDCAVTLDGESGILSSHLAFGDARRGWDFRSPGRGDVNFEAIVRALNDIGYDGPLSVEWEDSGMQREHGAAEAADFVRNLDFPRSGRAFDAAFEE